MAYFKRFQTLISTFDICLQVYQIQSLKSDLSGVCTNKINVLFPVLALQILQQQTLSQLLLCQLQVK